MKRSLPPIPGVLLLLTLLAPVWGAEPLSDEALEEITAQGQEDDTTEPSHAASAITVSAQNLNHTSLIIRSQAQTNLKGINVNNAAGRNQIANGINVR